MRARPWINRSRCRGNPGSGDDDTGGVAKRRAQRQVQAVASGLAELVPDPDRATAWTLMIDGTPQSHVDLADPTHLEFEYIRRMAAAIDLVAPAGQPLRVLHLGGGALTLPRYVAATRPGSAQRVVEIDGPLVDLVRRSLPFDPRIKLRVRVGDAREVVSGAREAGYDVVVLDVFAGARTPAHLASVEFVRAGGPGAGARRMADRQRRGRAATAVRPGPGRHDPGGATAGLPGRRRGGAARAPVRQSGGPGRPYAAAGRGADPAGRGGLVPGARGD